MLTKLGSSIAIALVISVCIATVNVFPRPGPAVAQEERYFDLAVALAAPGGSHDGPQTSLKVNNHGK